MKTSVNIATQGRGNRSLLLLSIRRPLNINRNTLTGLAKPRAWLTRMKLRSAPKPRNGVLIGVSFSAQASSRNSYQSRAPPTAAQKGGFNLRRVRRKVISDEPQRQAILGRIRLIRQYLPKNGVLLFFDVKPIFVKAYGGRRYTREKRLVLPLRQKTRGKFYLFLLYDESTGQVRWKYLDGKGSEYVCHFMKQVRCWYEAKDVWLALDQDSLYPRKSSVTRHTMRKLKLHWISLPKASPNDNPVENIFSDVQMMILDNSTDPNKKTTQQRISAHLSGRNRRKDRKIRINYLEHSHKY